MSAPTSEPVTPGRPSRPLDSPEGRPVLLARNPTSAFFFWQPARGDGPRPLVARISTPGSPARELAFHSGDEGQYVEDLLPGKTYRAEVFIRDAAGTLTPHSAPSRPVALPPGAPSGSLRVETLRVPWNVPIAKLSGETSDVRPAGPHLPPAERSADSGSESAASVGSRILEGVLERLAIPQSAALGGSSELQRARPAVLAVLPPLQAHVGWSSETPVPLVQAPLAGSSRTAPSRPDPGPDRFARERVPLAGPSGGMAPRGLSGAGR